MSNVIDLREYLIARARQSKVRYLIAAVEKYCKGQGPYDALAMAMTARRFTPQSWDVLDEIAHDAAKRHGEPFTLPSGPITRRLVLDEIEARASEMKLDAIDAEAVSQ